MTTETEKNNRPTGDPALASASGSTPSMPRKIVALEGRLKLERVPFHAPIGCDKDCKMNLVPWLCGTAETKTSASNIVMLEKYLEMLNGKYVKVTIEAEA